MAKKTPRSHTLLPARMSLNLDALHNVRFAQLDFPFQNALDAFHKSLANEYYAANPKLKAENWLPFDKQPPFRQLNQAILALCPVLVHAFEPYSGTRRMVAINRLHRDPQTAMIIDDGDQLPPVGAFTDLIDIWIDQWLRDAGLADLVKRTIPAALDTLKQALYHSETDWRRDITLDDLISQLDSNATSAYNVIPAAVIGLLHGQTMTLQHGGTAHEIIWRKAHDGGTNGLHLISQPIHKNAIKLERSPDGGFNKTEVSKQGYFVYSLRISVQTQTGRLKNGHSSPWIFLTVGVRRLMNERLHSDKIYKRKVSILVGLDRDQILPEYRERIAQFPVDSTLIALSATKNTWNKKDSQKGTWVWVDRLAELLGSYGLTTLREPQAILTDPTAEGNFGESEHDRGDVYYCIHAEGRKYKSVGAKGGGGNHPLTVGLSLKEATEVVQRVLELIPNVLTPDQPFEQDIAAPTGRGVPLMLRDYSFFKKGKADHTIEAIRRAIESAGKTRLDIAIVGYDPTFIKVVKTEIESMLPGTSSDGSGFINLIDVPISPLLLKPLDPGDLDPQDHFNRNRPAGFYDQWHEQMKTARYAKGKEWDTALSGIAWRPDAHRVAIIESRYKSKGFETKHESQSIKGVVREACCRLGIASQFLATFTLKDDGNLTTTARARLRNGLLDLLIRGTGAVYGNPRDLYSDVAKLASATSNKLDVVAFWHVDTKTGLHRDHRLVTVIAVRLRADGGVQFLAPGLDSWLPYADAQAALGAQFGRLRSAIRSGKRDHTLRLDNKRVMAFVLDVLQHRLDAPTIAVIEANWWRNAQSKYDIARWPQLRNKDLAFAPDVLDFRHVPNGGELFSRDDPRFANLLAVIRLRGDNETPQYTTTDTWDAANDPVDLAALSGYIDCTVTEPLHYFSVARQSDLQRDQSQGPLKGGYKQILSEDYAYKHAQLIEMIPLFVQGGFSGTLFEDGSDFKKALCRCIHFLRVSPAFTKGNTRLPYPMHLAKTLLEDVLCIVEAKKD